MCNQRNPLLQLFYLCVVLGAYGLILVYGYPQCPAALLPGWHRWTGALAVVGCLYLWYLACTVSPGLITEDTIHLFDNYEYDGVLYRAGRKCRTTVSPLPLP